VWDGCYDERINHVAWGGGHENSPGMKTHLGHYEIVAELGRGGMGVVYKGFEPALNRFVAIKELSPSLAHDPSLVERFLREARSMAALNDPHIIQIYFIGQASSVRKRVSPSSSWSSSKVNRCQR